MTKPLTKTIWDMDNVLFESEGLAMQIMDDAGYDLVTKYDASPELPSGQPLERGYIYKEYPGTSTDKIVEALIRDFHLPLEQIKEDFELGNVADDQVAILLAERITTDTINGFKEGLVAIPSISDTLRTVDANFGGIENRAGCTTSPKNRMDISLEFAVDADTGENAELATLFPDVDDRRISGYDYANKYEYFFSIHPDWDPGECAIVEDSKSGVSKAKAASAETRVVGTIAADYYENKQEQADILRAAGADIVVSHANDIAKALIWLKADLDPSVKPNFQSDVWMKEDTSPKLDTAPKQNLG